MTRQSKHTIERHEVGITTSRCKSVRMEALEARQMFAFGQIMPSFGEAGSALASEANGAIMDLDVMDDGQILASGRSGVVQYEANGSIDTTFGIDGKRTLATGATFVSTAIDRSSDKIYVVAKANVGTVLLRYTSAGATDTKFGTNGMALVSSDKDFAPAGVVVQADGKIIVAGSVATDSGNGAATRVYRLDTDGTSDSKFGDSGSRDVTLGITDLLNPTTRDRVAGVRVDANGNIVIGGESTAYTMHKEEWGSYAEYGDSVLAVARLTSDGTLDGRFGSDGIARTVYKTGLEPREVPPKFAMGHDGTMAVAQGDAQNDSYPYDSTRTVVAKFDATGNLLFVARSTGTDFGVVRAITSRSDGRFILVGWDTSGADSRLQMTTLAADGTFGNVVYADDLDPSTNEVSAGYAAALAITSDGDFIVGGSANNADQYLVMKFDAGHANDPRPGEFINGRTNDIVRDAAGGLHFAYFDAAERVLKYAYRAPNGLWNPAVTVDASPESGHYLSIATDSSNRAAIAYFDGNLGDLKFAQQSDAGGSRFSVETLEGKGIVGLYPSLAMDDSDRPTIAYYKKTGGDLKLVKRMATGWTFELVDSANDVGRCAQLVPQPENRRFSIAYTDATTNEIKLAARNEKNNWVIDTVATTTGGADFLSLGYDTNYYYSSDYQRPVVSYFDAGPADLKLARNRNVSQTATPRYAWSIATLATKGAVGMYGGLDSNEWDAFGVYYYNRTTNSVALFSQPKNDWDAAKAQTIVTGGGRNLSVFNSSNHIDIAYLDDATNALRVRTAPATYEMD